MIRVLRKHQLTTIFIEIKFFPGRLFDKNGIYSDDYSGLWTNS